MVHSSSTGQALSSANWLDDHFHACRLEYEGMVRLIGIQPGWHVLDAGCGSGSHLDVLTELVGPHGLVSALDLDPEHAAAIKDRSKHQPWDCPVTASVGSIASIPFRTGSFDAVWCANVLQYFDDVAASEVLAELFRVVRPGGVVAVKDVDVSMARVFPGLPFVLSHLSEISLRGPWPTAHSEGSVRGRLLRRFLEQAGLERVWQQTIVIERWSPLDPAAHRFWGNWLSFLADLAIKRGVPDEDLAFWRRALNPADTSHPVNDQAFYACEAQVVAVGFVGQRQGGQD